ncbi:MAG: YmfQ family protein [Peptostreptococcaceae bacterium]|nr:YmfQ family protein [Peptostreptococcaceae bacterium]
MNLINKLPSFYDNYITKPIQDSFSVEANSINDEVENTLNQFFVDSATYGLDYWEKMLGISKNNNDIQTRRENIKAKMRSRGTTSIEVIKNICEAYSYGEVEIVVDYANYSFEINFIGSIGVPKAFAELDKTINEIKPCHLAHSYKFNYNTHNILSKYTHEELANYTHEELRNSQELRGGQ